MKLSNTKSIVRLSMIISICVITRIYMSSLPNIQICSDIILLLAMDRKLIYSYVVNILVMFISGIFLGLGIWVIFQIITYFILSSLVYILKPQQFISKLLILFLSGLLYGCIIDFFNSLVYFNGISNYYLLLIYGIRYNFYHAIFNVIFYKYGIFRIEKMITDI